MDSGQRIYESYRLIATHLFGSAGEFAYESFDWINGEYFDNAVPDALILWDITDHGKSLGWCRSSSDGPPIIKLHPSTLGVSQYASSYREDGGQCWNIPNDLLGGCYAFDTLLHEMMHAHINYNLGGFKHVLQVENGPTAAASLWTPHNCPAWVNECNRIGRLMGLDVDVQMTCNVRQGKKVARVNGGNCRPESFPHDVPGRRDFYLRGRLPFATGSVKAK